jgi:ELWxxDGT repeat protein
MMNLKGVLLFFADGGLWRSDGTTVGTESIKSLTTNGAFIVAGTVAYFGGSDLAANYELWKTDGTSGGTVLVKELFAGATGGSPYAFVLMNGALYFSATGDAGSAGVGRSTDAGRLRRRRHHRCDRLPAGHRTVVRTRNHRALVRRAMGQSGPGGCADTGEVKREKGKGRGKGLHRTRRK